MKSLFQVCCMRIWKTENSNTRKVRKNSELQVRVKPTRLQEYEVTSDFMLLSHQLPGWKLAQHGFIFFFFLQRRDGKNNLESKNDSYSVQKLLQWIDYKKVTIWSRSFFLLLLPWKQTTIKRIFLLLSLKTYDSKDGITYSDRYFNLTATYHHIWKFQHPLHPFQPQISAI